MKIYRPTKRWKLTQAFGKNEACARTKDGKIERPFIITGKRNGVCPVGYVDFYTGIGMLGHSGEDSEAARGTEVRFDVDVPDMKWWGRVEVDDAQGMNVDIFSVDPVPLDELPSQVTPSVRKLWEEQGKRIHIKRRFTHGYRSFLEDKPLIHTGGYYADGRPEMKPEIKLGDLVMLADSTGASGGDHLHRAIKFTNGRGITIGGDNGYMGAVDESMWAVDKFVLDVVNGEAPPTRTLAMTLESLENNALQAEREGKPQMAAIIRAIKGIVSAFWNGG